MFGSPDCDRCGGYYPGNPGAYMGTWCYCNKNQEQQGEVMSWTLTVLNGIEISTQVGGTDWDSVKCLMLPFLQDFILEGKTKVAIYKSDVTELEDFTGKSYEDIDDPKTVYLDMKGQKIWEDLFLRGAESVELGQEKVLCIDRRDDQHCEVRLKRIS